MKVLSIVQSFPENVVTLSKFQGFVESGHYDYRVFCWKSPPSDWELWAAHIPRKYRAKVMVSGANRIFSRSFLAETTRFLGFLMTEPGLSLRHLKYHFPEIGAIRTVHRLLDDYKILQAKPALLHFEFGTNAVEKIYLKKLLDCKVVVSFRGYDLNFFQLENDAVYQPVWEQADGFHFLGQDLLEKARLRGMPDGKRYRLIPPAIDLERFSPTRAALAEAKSPINIVSVGRLVWKKGLHFGLLAFAEFLKKGGKGTYHLVGEGPAREELDYYVRELGISTQVIFHGKRSPQQVRDLLNQADVFLHPSISEGFCNAAMEAQAMELPVVCFETGGLPENVLHGETGFLSPLRDWSMMAQHLYELWENPTLRQQMGKNGRERMARFFSPEMQTAAFDALYQSVCAKDPSNSCPNPT